MHHCKEILTHCKIYTVELLWVELRLVDFLDVSKKNESPDFFPYIFLMKTYLWVEILCVEFFDVSTFFRGPYQENLVQFTTNKSKSCNYFDTFDLETFFTPYLAAKTIFNQLVWQVLNTQPCVQTAFVCDKMCDKML
jgi:hypothetical protein